MSLHALDSVNARSVYVAVQLDFYVEFSHYLEEKMAILLSIKITTNKNIFKMSKTYWATFKRKVRKYVNNQIHELQKIEDLPTI